jgi:hypothetical protein
MVGWVLRGAAAGAAGTTVLNVVTYLDMAVRGRPASSTPENTVEKLAEVAHVPIPGEGVTRASRVEGLGALTGLVAGIGVGGLLTTFAVLLSTNGPMTVLGVTDPRTWSAVDWLSDLVPHLAYAAVVNSTIDALDRS